MRGNMTQPTADLPRLLQQCQEIRPDIQYVQVEQSFGTKVPRKLSFWAFGPDKAFGGDTPEELLNDIRESEGMVAA